MHLERGHADAAMVSPRIVIHVWAGGDADIEAKVVLAFEEGVVEIVLRVAIVKFGGPEVSVASIDRCEWAEEGDVRATDRVLEVPGTIYRGRGRERLADTRGLDLEMQNKVLLWCWMTLKSWIETLDVQPSPAQGRNLG